MADQKESSVLFSLKELMNLEEDRIRQEDNDKKKKEQAELQARADAEVRAREAEENRLRAEEERRRQDEQRTREGAARVEGIRHAEVEKARTDAENEARLRAMQQQQEHERQLAALSQDKKKKQLTYVVVGIAALLVVGGAGTGFALYKTGKDAADEKARLEQQAREKDAQLAKLQADFKAQADAVSQAQSEAAGAKSEVEKQAALAKLAAAQRQQETTQRTIQAVRTGGGAGPVTGAKTTPKPSCTCQAGDPLCACL